MQISNHYQSLMAGRYHDIYKNLGLTQGRSGKNFHCINSKAHSGGKDNNPSMSVDNELGQYFCHTCKERGNLSTFLKTYGPGVGYFDFCAAQTGVEMVDIIKEYFPENLYGDEDTSQEAEKWREEQKKELKAKPKKKIEKTEEDPMRPIEGGVEKVKEWTRTLLASDVPKKFLMDEKHISDKMISKYGIGYSREHQSYVFPAFDKKGQLINVKMYNPFASKEHKWYFPYPNRRTNPPMPFENLTNKVIYIFEGEPDTYCACSHDIPGVTFGAASRVDIHSMFDEHAIEELFTDKIINICFDADEAGKKGAINLATQLYPYAKEVKIIDFNISDINPNGLDPTKSSPGLDGKITRDEKDFSDFMGKNKFGEHAVEEFSGLVGRTPVFHPNPDRRPYNIIKASLSSISGKGYVSHDGSTEVRITASVENTGEHYYLAPEKIKFKCPMMCGAEHKRKVCSECNLVNIEGFGEDEVLDVQLITRYTDKDGKGKFRMSPKQILDYIDISDRKRKSLIMEDFRIPARCTRVDIDIISTYKINIAQLTTPVNDISDVTEKEFCDGIDVANIQRMAYILGDQPPKPNKSYIMQGVSTTSPKNQTGCLYIYDMKQRETSIEKFELNDDAIETLKIFQPEARGESLDEHLKKRYSIYSRAAGLNHREDLFFIADTAYCSALHIDHPTLLPKVTRGWVEVLMAGETRSGKTIAAKALKNWYQFGDIVTSSGNASEAGLVAGLVSIDKGYTIKWGIFPQNDKGMVIIDETSDLPIFLLKHINNLRSEGVAEIAKITAGKAQARSRKIFISNPRTDMTNKNTDIPVGLDLLLEICTAPQVLARFDLAYISLTGDVESDDYKSEFTGFTDGYSPMVMQTLLRWVLSRDTSDFYYEPGFEQCVIEQGRRLRKIFDDKTQLVNGEIPAKLVRCATSIALRTVSIYDEDYSKVLVKKEHVKYIVDWMIRVYSGPNFKLDVYSETVRRARQMGDMRFMDNILRYVDPVTLISTDKFSNQTLPTVFGEYINKVTAGKCWIVSSINDNDKVTGLNFHECANRLISLLVARRCLKLEGSRYVKTSMFSEWLSKNVGGRNDKRSTILEVDSKDERESQGDS